MDKFLSLLVIWLQLDCIKGFEAQFGKNKTFHLRKSSAHLSDSAEHFCTLSDTVTEILWRAEHKPPETL
ncbi:hypothetical protein QTO34_019480 [Cnephaeus nilssonii]|uniref:Uncharacterized protein n=1 Tax=Cnephaeus nilssonii TaxID=3371016 RepID=A0AA40LM28_CNENI|nr:hypothetical protein QTO34_019480 [Eptesicus nilssonii]